ncbi:nucleoside-diphosphate kinase [Ornithobacterium rhinotracheale]|uniref:Nucleoside diphosphate kinase n=1 Tax=Ornithobacterium rhinotracheale (strain ATCC 51463 / DSM 15997 / CCUG 23171 / CIP 104009 / LMG 9086) TaxID=867902 RepID=I4A2L9_ORNRL|nr:nucleoside-diphosphate kinase [Ornithobacterium rhinotracheale]AFL98203.1 nucleoside diphosphate kinase [Ornithobacterium rhinotracheale DSM 15997]AIP99948.1 nucleoside diphosphate kinase [Ornithobacterium rhinotracheale ORT-UMN 88]KGB66107.1 nucleoside diphosphate kinase [Ornithobacterium rhinotracheale H06-030791]MCK0193496.1 nucleoside-diphosphate kinase [Ornithobacterium rhinotracheale]MCK0201301.1 nucleoside-diphosphate kinase [Ornithobacterium rhinotracheale]
MQNNLTFTMIKPNAVKKGYIGAILNDIVNAGFKIRAMKLTQLSRADAQHFYAVHKDRPFFDDLVNFMISGPIVAAVLEKENAVADYRKLIGATDPAEAEEGTLRKKYADSKQANAVHGADSNENAEIEAKFHFSGREIFEY